MTCLRQVPLFPARCANAGEAGGLTGAIADLTEGGQRLQIVGPGLSEAVLFVAQLSVPVE